MRSRAICIATRYPQSSALQPCKRMRRPSFHQQTSRSSGRLGKAALPQVSVRLWALPKGHLFPCGMDSGGTPLHDSCSLAHLQASPAAVRQATAYGLLMGFHIALGAITGLLLTQAACLAQLMLVSSYVITACHPQEVTYAVGECGPAAMLILWLLKALCHYLHQAMYTLHLVRQLHLQSWRRLAPGTTTRHDWAAQGSLLLPRCTNFCGLAPPPAGLVTD